jgi:putative FmdB family regulatory protein
MPLYEYECTSCGARFENITSMSRADEAGCPRCGAAQTRRLLSVIGGLGGRAPEPQAACGQGACGSCS